MESTMLLNKIQKKFSFLIKKYKFSLKKGELHWLGGALVEYEKEKIIISILYDRREGWFYCKLFSNDNIDKAPLFFHTELNKLCKLSTPVIPIDKDEEIINYLDALSTCLEINISAISQKFEVGDYWKQ